MFETGVDSSELTHGRQQSDTFRGQCLESTEVAIAIG